MKGIEKLQENNDLGEPELNSNNNGNDNDKVCATTTSNNNNNNNNKTNGVNARHNTTNGTSHNGTKDKNKQQ